MQFRSSRKIHFGLKATVIKSDSDGSFENMGTLWDIVLTSIMSLMEYPQRSR